MFLIDIAVPRDVDPAVNKLPNVYRYDVDDLQSVAEANLKEREREAQAAQAIVEQDVDRYLRWHEALGAVPAVRALRDRFSRVSEAELEKVLVQLKHLPPQDQARVQRLVRTVVNKLLHTPSMRLKQATGTEEGRLFADALTRLFDLGTGEGDLRTDSTASTDEATSEGQLLHLPLGGKP